MDISFVGLRPSQNYIAPTADFASPRTMKRNALGHEQRMSTATDETVNTHKGAPGDDRALNGVESERLMVKRAIERNSVWRCRAASVGSDSG